VHQRCEHRSNHSTFLFHPLFALVPVGDKKAPSLSKGHVWIGRDIVSNSTQNSTSDERINSPSSPSLIDETAAYFPKGATLPISRPCFNVVSEDLNALKCSLDIIPCNYLVLSDSVINICVIYIFVWVFTSAFTIVTFRLCFRAAIELNDGLNIIGRTSGGGRDGSRIIGLDKHDGTNLSCLSLVGLIACFNVSNGALSHIQCLN
jgi:hypothetical protein